MAYLEFVPDHPLAMSIQLSDALGRKVWAKPQASYQAVKSRIAIPLSNLASGPYWYAVYNADGQLLHGGRIVKE
jgi:hypothetical protein